MTPLSPAERLDALAARGVMLYLTEAGELHAKCEPCFAPLLYAALPAIRHHKAALHQALAEAAPSTCKLPGVFDKRASR